MYIVLYNNGMKRIHTSTGRRIQNGAPFDWMLEKIMEDKNKGGLSPTINATDVSRHALIWYYKHLGYTTVPKEALEMLKIRGVDIDL